MATATAAATAVATASCSASGSPVCISAGQHVLPKGQVEVVEDIGLGLKERREGGEGVQLENGQASPRVTALDKSQKCLD